MLKIKKRPMNVDDFLKLKKIQPYALERSQSKAPNFSSFFGSKAWMLMELLVKGGYTEEDFDSIIDNVGLKDKYEENTDKYGEQKSDFEIKGYTVSSFLRKQFFDMYPGCEERILREIEFAVENGFIQHYHGIKRMIPELLLMHFNYDPEEKKPPELVGTDRSLYMAILNNFLNVCANTNIQGSEPPQAFMLGSWCMHIIKKWTKEYPAFEGTYIFNNVHDSLDFYCAIENEPIIIPLIRYCLEYPVAPGFGVALPCEIEEANVSKGQMYKHGKTINFKDFDALPTAIKKWNEAHGTNLQMPEIPRHKDGTPFIGFAEPLEKPYFELHPEEIVKLRWSERPKNIEIPESARPKRTLVRRTLVS